jgi:hypothetical protein
MFPTSSIRYPLTTDSPLGCLSLSERRLGIEQPSDVLPSSNEEDIARAICQYHGENQQGVGTAVRIFLAERFYSRP